MIVKYVTQFYTHNLGWSGKFGCVCVQHFIYGLEFDGRRNSKVLVLTWSGCITTNS